MVELVTNHSVILCKHVTFAQGKRRIPLRLVKYPKLECEGLCETWTRHEFHKAVRVPSEDVPGKVIFDYLYRCKTCKIDRQFGRVFEEVKKAA